MNAIHKEEYCSILNKKQVSTDIGTYKSCVSLISFQGKCTKVDGVSFVGIFLVFLF